MRKRLCRDHSRAGCKKALGKRIAEKNLENSKKSSLDKLKNKNVGQE